MSCGRQILLSTVAERSPSYSYTGGAGGLGGSVGWEEDALLQPPGLFHVSLFPLGRTPPHPLNTRTHKHICQLDSALDLDR